MKKQSKPGPANVGRTRLEIEVKMVEIEIAKTKILATIADTLEEINKKLDRLLPDEKNPDPA